MPLPRQDIFALAYVTDTSAQLALKYLFASVFRRKSLVLNSLQDFSRRLRSGPLPSVVTVWCMDDCDEIFRLVSYAKSLPDAPTVMIVDYSGVGDCEARAFQAGADDFVQGGRSLEEFAYRLRARMPNHPVWDDVCIEETNWDVHGFVASRAGLTSVESQILSVLIDSVGHIVTRNDLSQSIDGRPWKYGDRKFDVHVAKLRKKLSSNIGPQLSVQTIRSMGYRLSLDSKRALTTSTAE